MKKFLNTVLITAFTTIATCAFSQTKPDTTTVGQDLKKAGRATGKAVKKAGKKVGEVGTKGAAKVKDKSLKNEKGPNGETVYIDKYQRKYYVNKDAKRVYIK